MPAAVPSEETTTIKYRPPAAVAPGGVNPAWWLLAAIVGYEFVLKPRTVPATVVTTTAASGQPIYAPPPAPYSVGAPTYLSVLSATAHSALITANPVLGAVRYDLHDQSGLTLARATPAPGAAPVWTVQGLQSGTNYTVYAVAIDSANRPGPPSVSLTFQTATTTQVVPVEQVTNVNVTVNVAAAGLPVTPAPAGTPVTGSLPSGIAPIIVPASTKYARPTNQVVSTPVGPAYVLRPTAYALRLPTYYSASQVSALSGGSVNAPAVMPIPMSPQLDPTSSQFNPEAVVETATQQQRVSVPAQVAALGVTSQAQLQAIINWYIRNNPDNPRLPTASDYVQAWLNAGSPAL
jgi:hypothetical protein